MDERTLTMLVPGGHRLTTEEVGSVRLILRYITKADVYNGMPIVIYNELEDRVVHCGRVSQIREDKADEITSFQIHDYTQRHANPTWLSENEDYNPNVHPVDWLPEHANYLFELPERIRFRDWPVLKVAVETSLLMSIHRYVASEVLGANDLDV